MYTQITVQAKRLRTGDTIVGLGGAVDTVTPSEDGWLEVRTGAISGLYRPTEHLRVVRYFREVGP